MKIVFSPAASAGLISDFGLLPIIHVVRASRACRTTTSAYASRCFSRGTSTAAKCALKPERINLSCCSAGFPLVIRISRGAPRGRQSFRNSSQQLDLLTGNRIYKVGDACMLLFVYRTVRELFEAMNEGATKYLQAVSVFHRVLALDLVEHFADLVGLNSRWFR